MNMVETIELNNDEFDSMVMDKMMLYISTQTCLLNTVYIERNMDRGEKIVTTSFIDVHIHTGYILHTTYMYQARYRVVHISQSQYKHSFFFCFYILHVKIYI